MDTYSAAAAFFFAGAFFAAAFFGAAFLAGAAAFLGAAFFLPPDFPAFSAIRTSASSRVTAYGSNPLGRVALTFSHFT